MTAPPLASGRALRCDPPRCNQPATIDKDVWSFCAQHANEPAQPAPRQPTRPAVAVGAHATGANPLVPPTATGIGLLLEQASGHSNTRVRKLGQRVEQHLDDLRALITSLLERMAAEQIARGYKRVGVKALFEVLRYSHGRTYGDVWKLNNDYTALFARALIEAHPDWRPFIELRTRRSEAA